MPGKILLPDPQGSKSKSCLLMLIWGTSQFLPSNLSKKNSSGWSPVLGFLLIAYTFTIDCVYAGMSYPQASQASIEACGRSRVVYGGGGEGFLYNALEILEVWGNVWFLHQLISMMPHNDIKLLACFPHDRRSVKNFRHCTLHCDRCHVWCCNKCVLQNIREDEVWNCVETLSLCLR